MHITPYISTCKIEQTVINMRITICTVFGLLAGAMAAPALSPEEKLAAQIKSTDAYLFSLTLENFLAVAKVQEGKLLGLDWSTNGCSSAPNTPFNFDCTLT